LKLGDASTPLLSEFQRFFTLGLELLFEPIAVTTRELKLLFQRVLPVLGTVQLALGILLRLLKSSYLSSKLNISLMLLGELFGESLVSLVV